MRKEPWGFPHGDIPPPRPHPGYDEGVIPTELYPESVTHVLGLKCHPCTLSRTIRFRRVISGSLPFAFLAHT